MALSRDQILGATDFVFVELEVEEWGGTVRLRGLSASERDAFESSVGVTYWNIRGLTIVFNIAGSELSIALFTRCLMIFL